MSLFELSSVQHAKSKSQTQICTGGYEIAILGPKQVGNSTFFPVQPAQIRLQHTHSQLRLRGSLPMRTSRNAQKNGTLVRHRGMLTSWLSHVAPISATGRVASMAYTFSVISVVAKPAWLSASFMLRCCAKKIRCSFGRWTCLIE